MPLVLEPHSSIVDVVHAYLLDAVRTPLGRHRGGLAGIRTDDLAALPITELLRAPFVLPKPDVPFQTAATLYHTQVGWRMINSALNPEWTVSLGGAAENVAAELGISREEQDQPFQRRSHVTDRRAFSSGGHV